MVISFVPVAGHLYCGDKKTLIFHRKPPLPPESGRQFRRSGCCKHACAPDLVDLPQSLLILSLAHPFPANLGIFVGPDALHMLSCLPFAAKFQPEWNWGRFRPPKPVLFVGNPRDMEQRAFQPFQPGSFWRPNPPDLELRALSLPLYSIAKGGSILQLVLWYIFPAKGYLITNSRLLKYRTWGYFLTLTQNTLLSIPTN